jgi:hypothetical protein
MTDEVAENEMPDDELQNLLDQLDEPDSLVTDTMESEAGIEEAPIEPECEASPEVPTKKKEDTSASSLKASETTIRPVVDELVASDARRFDGETKVDTEEEQQVQNSSLTKYLERLDDVTDEVLAACRSDRQEAQDVIGIYKKAIEDALTAKAPPARMWVDGLVKAVEVKAGINGNAVKMIEANAKMLAATKGGGTFNQQINVGGSENLDDVLSQELSEDDEY